MSVFAYFNRPIAVAVAASTLAFAPPSAAQGDLLVAPTRVTLNGGGSSQVILSNIGADPATYRISLELRRMDAEGNLVEVLEANANAAEKAALEMVRYAPRRIALAPNQPQAIRISARPAPEMPDGEYRVHMMFRAVPDVTPVADSAAEPTASGLSIKLTPIYGLTIPVIVRKGQLEMTASLSNPQILHEKAGSHFAVELSRTGTRSSYGEIRVLPRGGGEPILLARGIAVYPEVAQRKVEMSLSPEQAAKLKGPVRVEYREMPENGGALIASLDANLG